MDLELALRSLPRLLRGLEVTVVLVAQSTLLGFPLVALPMGLARHAPWRPLRWGSATYDFVFRGTPLIVLLYIVYYGLAAWPPVRHSALWILFREPYLCALVALSLNTGAYGAEIVQGAIRAVPKGLVEAGEAAGLSGIDVLWWIKAPIALRYALASYGHEIIQLTKSTAVVSTITILDLMGTASNIYSETLDAITPFVAAGVFYLGLILLVTWGMARIERRLYLGAARGPAPGRGLPASR